MTVQNQRAPSDSALVRRIVLCVRSRVAHATGSLVGKTALDSHWTRKNLKNARAILDCKWDVIDMDTGYAHT